MHSFASNIFLSDYMSACFSGTYPKYWNNSDYKHINMCNSILIILIGMQHFYASMSLFIHSLLIVPEWFLVRAMSYNGAIEI